MARAMEATFCARRWQDTALNLIGDAKSEVRANPDACGTINLHPGRAILKADAFRPLDNQTTCLVSSSVANGALPASTRCFARGRAGLADDSQLIHALFPEVVASVSAEQKLSKPAQKGPLGLTLNHSDVFRAWETRSSSALKPAVSPISADTTFEALHIKPAKAVLEATCGPLPCYDLSQASIRGALLSPVHAQQPQPFFSPASALSDCAPVSVGHSVLRLAPNTLQPFISRAGSINAVSGHGSCSTGSLSCCSSPVSRNGTPESIEPLDSMLDGVSMEVDAPCLDSGVGCLKADLEELAASLGPCIRGSSSEDFGIFLSDSDDASDGTHLSGGHLWGGSDDAYDSIFGSADADASMAVDSHHSDLAEDNILPDRFSVDDHRLRGSRHGSGGFPAAATYTADVKPLLRSAPSACSTDMFPAASSGSPMGASYHDFSQDSSTGSGALLSAVPQYEALLPLHVGPFFPDAALACLSQSLVAIPAKTAECAKSARAACAAKCKEKRQNRNPAKICYEMRKIDAEKRPRYKGRFVKRADLITQEVMQQCEVTSTPISDDLATCFTYPPDPFPFLDEICTL